MIKKNTYPWLLLTCFLIPIVCYPCDCVMKNLINPSHNVQTAAMKASECILVGKVTYVDRVNQIFKLRVIESLDGGDLQGNMYIGKNWKYCFPYVQEKGTWLIYGFTEDGYLKINICGISRSFDMFSPTSTGALKDSPDMELREEFLSSLYEEIKALREERYP